MGRRLVLLLTATIGVAAATTFAADTTLRLSIAARNYRVGELLLVTVDSPVAASAVRIHAFDRTVAASPGPDHTWLALVGVDLAQTPGPYVVVAEADVDGATSRASESIVVTPRTFRTRRLRVAPDYVNPPAPLLERITSEQAFLRGVLADSFNERLWDGPFVRPVPGPANSSFGTRSVYNGESRNPHAGADFLSPTGTPIHAPSSGRVVCARPLFFTGNTVVIDHGLGLFSTLAHLSRLDVHEGDRIRSGQVVGLVGATGRVTGAHLHWGMSASGARVDPLSALEVLKGIPAQASRSAR